MICTKPRCPSALRLDVGFASTCLPVFEAPTASAAGVFLSTSGIELGRDFRCRPSDWAARHICSRAADPTGPSFGNGGVFQTLGAAGAPGDSRNGSASGFNSSTGELPAGVNMLARGPWVQPVSSNSAIGKPEKRIITLPPARDAGSIRFNVALPCTNL